MHCQKALFLFCLSTEHFYRRIVVCPGSLWQSSVVPFYVFSSAMGSSMAFTQKALLGLVCGIWYVLKPLPCSRSAFRSLDVLRGVFSTVCNNFRRLLSLSFLFLLRPGRFLKVTCLANFLVFLNMYLQSLILK